MIQHTTLRIVLLTTVVLVLSGATLAANDPDVVVFYREGCNDCRHLDRVLEELQTQYPTLNVRHIEEAELDAQLMWVLAGEYGVFPSTYPVTFAGDEAIVGIDLDKELRLRAAVEDCITNGCRSPLASVDPPTVPWRTLVIVGLVAIMLLLWLIE